ncbi:hypothetical protein BH11ARM2_BH11ARM2_07930 [soil metagenome]
MNPSPPNANDESLLWQERAQRILSEASLELSSSLDYRTTLHNIAHLAVRELAEWCSVDVWSERGELDKVVVAHADPRMVEWAREFSAKYPTDLESNAGLALVLRTGESILVSDVTDEMIVQSAKSAEHLADVRAIGVGSAILAPLSARGVVLGAFTLVDSQRGRFGERDLELAKEIGRRAGIALDNARLFTQVQAELDERRRAEAALKVSEARFRELADAMPVMVWVTTAMSQTEFTNRFYHQYTGSKDSELRSAAGWAEVVHPDDLTAARANYTRCFLTKQVWEQELRLRRYDGEYRWHLSRAIPIMSHAGELLRWYGTSTDIHEQKLLAEELERRVEERTEELAAANRELQAFIHGVAHDLRSPLRAIASTSQILLEDVSDRLEESEQALLRRQSKAAVGLGQLVDDLLEMSKVARKPVKRVHIDLSDVAAQVVGEVTALHPTPGLTFEVAPGIEADGDAEMLRLVLRNLLDNAAKFSPSGGKVHFRREGGHYTVSDEGMGFQMEYAGQIFDEFTRLEASVPGTGLGLSNVRRIIERHGGRIWAESEPGRGSTFWFTLT